MWWRRLAGITAVLVVLSCATARAELGVGIGVLGDSYSDEYRFYPPDRSTSRNWVEILAETRGLNFGRFEPSSRGEPRNQGFEYNWARSDATTDDMIATGQHLGLASQVARGDVQIVFVFIGGNDFINALSSTDPHTALVQVSGRAIRNVRQAIDAILAADRQVHILIGTLPDIRFLPDCARTIASGSVSASIADEFSAAMSRFNHQVRVLALSHPRIEVVDLDLTLKLLNLLDPNAVSVAGVKLDRHRPSNDINHFFLGDGRHLGTVGQGMIAQAIIETLNTRLNTNIASLTFREIFAYARSQSTRGRIDFAQWPSRNHRAASSASAPEGSSSAP